MYQKIEPAIAKNTDIALYQLYSKTKFKIMPQKTLQQFLHPQSSSKDQFVPILSRVDHPFVLRGFEIYDIDSRSYLVAEGFSGEEMYQHIWPTVKKLPEDEAARIVYRLLYTLNYFHRRNIAHGNMSLDTVALI